MNITAQPNPLEAMRNVFMPDVMLFFIIRQNNAGFDFSTPIVIGTEKHIKDQYEHNSWQLDPFLNEAIASTHTILGSSTSFPDNQWWDLQYYKTFLQPHNLDHELAVYIRESPKVLGGISVLRTRGRRPFVESDLAKAHLLLPYLAQIVHDYLAVQSDSSEGHFSLLCDRPEQGVILLDANCEVLGYNPSGLSYCLSLTDHRSDLQAGPGRHRLDLPATILRDCQELKRLFDNDLYFACTPKSRVLVTKEGSLIQCHCTIVAQYRNGRSECSFLVSLDSPLELVARHVEGATANARLTTREQQIVQLVVGGYTNRQIADTLYISRFTVENHLKQVFAKTKVQNRTALANWFLLSQSRSQTPGIDQGEVPLGGHA